VVIIEALNETIHQTVRPRVMADFATHPVLQDVEFTYRRDMLEATIGNLDAHLHILEEAGYISINKTFIERKPRTHVSTTTEGRRVFSEHVAAQEAILIAK
jgi:DNA-binding MarR family transcriptional regulator